MLRLALFCAAFSGLLLAGCDSRGELEYDDSLPPGTGGGGGAQEEEEEEEGISGLPEQEPNGGGIGSNLQIYEMPSPLVIAGSVQSNDDGSSLLGSVDDYEDYFAVRTLGSPTATLSSYSANLALAIVGPLDDEGGFGGSAVSNGDGPTETVSLSGSGVYLIAVSFYDADGSEGASDYQLRVTW